MSCSWGMRSSWSFFHEEIESSNSICPIWVFLMRKLAHFFMSCSCAKSVFHEEKNPTLTKKKVMWKFFFLMRKTHEFSSWVTHEIQNGVYSLKWRLTDRYLRWGTLAGPGRRRSVQIEWLSAGTAHLGFPALLLSVPPLAFPRNKDE